LSRLRESHSPDRRQRSAVVRHVGLIEKSGEIQIFNSGNPVVNRAHGDRAGVILGNEPQREKGCLGLAYPDGYAPKTVRDLCVVAGKDQGHHPGADAILWMILISQDRVC